MSAALIAAAAGLPRTAYHDLLSPGEEALLRRAREVAHDALAPRAEEVDRAGTFPLESFAAVRAAGLLGALGPPAFGGAGGGALAATLVLEALAAGCASTAALVLFHFTVVRRLTDVGSRAQQERLLPVLCADGLGASAWAEPGSGADKKGLATTAVAIADGYRLDGRKSYCTGAGHAEVYTVLVGHGGPAGADEPLFGRNDQSFFVVRRDNPGLHFGPPFDGLGLRGSESGELILDQAPVAAADRLGGEGDGLRIMACNRRSGLHPGTLGLGLAAAALATALQFARERDTARHQGVRFALADAAATLAGARLQTLEAARLADRRAPGAARAALLAKVAAAAAAQQVTAAAVQLLGKAGYARGSGVERQFRDARALSIMGPTSELCRDMVGAHDAGLSDLDDA